MESICVGKDIIECKLSQSPVIVLECFAGLCIFYAAGFSSGQGPGRGWIRCIYESHSLEIIFDINITIMIFNYIYILYILYIDISNIRTLLHVRVRTQDPKPKKNMERSTRAIPLYHIVLLFLSQPRNVRRLQGPPVYFFFGRWQTTLVGGLQSTQPS
jgi:hypothetical protein